MNNSIRAVVLTEGGCFTIRAASSSANQSTKGKLHDNFIRSDVVWYFCICGVNFISSASQIVVADICMCIDCPYSILPFLRGTGHCSSPDTGGTLWSHSRGRHTDCFGYN